MNKKRMKRGARHHWWPKSLSQHWTNKDGHIQRIDFSGKASNARPLVIARISGGHDIVFDGPSPWEQTFEHYFDSADGNFPRIVNWLNGLVESHAIDQTIEKKSLFCSHECDEEALRRLLEGMLSLVIRSPRFRNSVSDFVENLRGSLPKSERRRLEAANLRQSYIILTERLSVDGKFVIFISNSQEFIFGDGFYHNLNVATQNLFDARILVPFTPKLSILYARPMQYNPEPRLMTRIADPDLIELFNETVQVYSKDSLFFRSEEPILTKDFVVAEHREYGSYNPIDNLIGRIPGVAV